MLVDIYGRLQYTTHGPRDPSEAVERAIFIVASF